MVHIFSPKLYSAALWQNSLWYFFTSWFCLHNYERVVCVLLKKRKSITPFPLFVVHKRWMKSVYLQWHREGLWVLILPGSYHQNTQFMCLYKPWNTSGIKTVCDFTKTSGEMLFYSVTTVEQLYLFLTPLNSDGHQIIKLFVLKGTLKIT